MTLQDQFDLYAHRLGVDLVQRFLRFAVRNAANDNRRVRRSAP